MAHKSLIVHAERGPSGDLASKVDAAIEEFISKTPKAVYESHSVDFVRLDSGNVGSAFITVRYELSGGKK